MITKKKNKFIFSLVLLFFTNYSFAKGMPKEFFKIQNSSKSKKYFLDYIYKMVEKENINILKEKEFVKNTLHSNLLTLQSSPEIFNKLLKIKKKYKIKNIYTYKEYEEKIDIIPPSQALAQAAIESGWGKSRFIKKANNIFGHWTYNPKIGMLPKNRVPGATHYIRVFISLQDSINAYMLNLNKNRAYSKFRKERYKFRIKNKNPDGFILSQTMINYSGIAHLYLKILKNVIKKNNLAQYDEIFYKNLNNLQGEKNAISSTSKIRFD